jgi:protease I
MELNGKKVAILVENYYQELEVWYPLLRLREAGAEVDTVGPQAGATYTSKLGYPVKANRAIGDVAADNYDAVVIPGGWAPDHMRRDPRFVHFVREMDAAGKPIGAICHGGWLLCSAGILRGRRATSFFSIRDDMVNAGASYVDAEAVVDGNLITSRIPDDLPAFCKAFIAVTASVREPSVARSAR